MSREERIQEVLTLLKDGNLSPFDVILEVLDEANPGYSSYRNELYKEGNRKLSTILDCILTTESGKQKLWSWMRPNALMCISDTIDTEMDSVAEKDRLSGLAEIDPDFIKSWTVATASERAPVLTEILFRAAQTSRAKERNKRKHPDSVCSIINLGPL